ncbi:MAG: hypothetical protein ABIR16_02530, partial [Dokdonella sp.]
IGTQSFERIALWKLLLLWASLAAGAMGLVWLLLSGLARLLMRRIRSTHSVVVPLISTGALLLPLPFFLSQSFLQLGDLTWASGSLAVVTGFLPVAMLTGMAMHFRRRRNGAMARADLFAMAAVLQWSFVLMVWGLLPVRLWA